MYLSIFTYNRGLTGPVKHFGDELCAGNITRLEDAPGVLSPSLEFKIIKLPIIQP
jgi:hypothetical protein